MLIASSVKCVCPQSGLPHGFRGGDFTGTPSRNHPLEIVRQRHRLTAGVLALLFSYRDSLALTLEDVLAFEFCHCREHGQHEFAGGYGVEPFLCRHYDRMERRDPLKQPYETTKPHYEYNK